MGREPAQEASTIGYSQACDIHAARLRPLTEAQLAEGMRREGSRVSRHRGRWWYQPRRGMYWTVHWTARVSADQARPPSPLRWGFRTTLADDDAHHANGALVLQLLADVDGYDIGALPSKRRNQLRKAWRELEFVALDGPALLHEQGYRVLASAHARTGYGSLPREADYHREIDAEFGARGRLIIAALARGRLAGYAVTRAVERTGYIATLQLDTELLRTNVGTGLVYEFVQVCRRTPGIREVVYGPHSAHDPPLCAFKEGMGFPPVRLPSRWGCHPAAAALLRRRRPDFYYYLSGQQVESPAESSPS